MRFSAAGLPDGLRLDEASGIITGRVSRPGEYPVKLSASNAHGTNSITLKIVIGDTIALTPPMGWNSWNFFSSRVDDQKVRAAADAMVASGLVEHGWTYINIDDCWQGTRDAQGHIQGNAKFPDIKTLSDYVHGKGLKFGMYSSPGPRTCAGFEGTYKHEDEDAQTYADWGVDYVKYDWCSYGQIANARREALYEEQLPKEADEIRSLIQRREALPNHGANSRRNPLTPEQRAQAKEINDRLKAIHNQLAPEKVHQLELQVFQEPYEVFHHSLAKVDRDIVYSLCQYGMGDSWTWAADVGGNSWRTTGDIQANWPSIARIGFAQNGHEKWAKPGHWNDPDMLEVGNGKLTPDEMYSHFSLWCLLDSPLLIGCDMSKMDPLVVSIFSNDEVIAVNQDALGRQASRVTQEGDTQVWAKPLADGSLAVGLFNLANAESACTAKWSDLGITGSRAVRDLWRQRDLGPSKGEFKATLPPHGVMLVRIAGA
jgi:alpha-galactosidase